MDNWNTPKWLKEHFKNHFDPCPELPTFNGLIIDWKSPSFVNCPYSDPLPWVNKAIMESNKGIDIIMLLRVDPSTKWFCELMKIKSHISFFNERLKFNEIKTSPSFSSMLVFIEGKK